MFRKAISGEPPSRQWRGLGLVLSALALVLLATAGWIRFRFGVVTFEQILLNLPIAGGGEGVGNDSLAVEAVLVCLALPVAIVLLISLLSRRRRRRPAAKAPRRFRALIPVAAFMVSFTLFLVVAGFPQYASAVLRNLSIAPYYVPPQVLNQPDQPRNLITIYLESVENTFSDTELFGDNLIADLDRATRGWANYDGLLQYPGGGWTMAGVVSTQCGIPLKSRLLVAGMNPNDFGEQVESYLPGVDCLGDILAANGYTNVYLGGAHTRFAGKDTFLTGHGYQRVQGLSYWEAEGEDQDNISLWGLSDYRLFAHARQAVTELHAAGQPFNLTMLTLDTHEPAGVFPSCSTDDEVAMATAIRCSTRAVAGFLGYLESQGYLDDTVVVVMGDHLKATSEGGDFKAELDGTSDRTIVYRVWSPERITFTREHADQLSVFATTLDLLDFNPRYGRAGVGVSFVRDADLADTALELSDDDYDSVVRSPSFEIYREFWEDKTGG